MLTDPPSAVYARDKINAANRLTDTSLHQVVAFTQRNAPAGTHLDALAPTTLSVSSYVFQDLDADGVPDIPFVGYEVWLTLSKMDNGYPIPVDMAISTGGFYEIPVIESGVYFLTFDIPYGLVETTNHSGVNFYIGLPWSDNPVIDFGLAPVTTNNTVMGQVTGLIQLPIGGPNRTIIVPRGDNRPLPQVTVELWNATQTQQVLPSATTDSNCTYAFNNLTSGTYWLHLVKPSYGFPTWWHPVGWWPWQEPWHQVSLISGTSISNFNIGYDRVR